MTKPKTTETKQHEREKANVSALYFIYTDFLKINEGGIKTFSDKHKYSLLADLYYKHFLKSHSHRRKISSDEGKIYEQE